MRNYKPVRARANLKDITGQKFGYMTVVRLLGIHNKHAYWLCLCDCGNTAEIRGEALRSGHTLSCGCAQKEWASSPKSHGLSKHPLFKVWSGMIQRCENEKSPDYENYGGRGISVCPEWHEFSAFIRNMPNRPKGTTLDRIDNDKGYEPANCRWATHAEQCMNKRTTFRVEVAGKSLTLTEMEALSGIPHNVIRMRLNRGFDPIRAMTQPMRDYPRQLKTEECEDAKAA